MLDGFVLARKTGAGAIKRPVLLALGLRSDSKKEVIDFRLAPSESAAGGFLPTLPPQHVSERMDRLLERRRDGLRPYHLQPLASC